MAGSQSRGRSNLGGEVEQPRGCPTCGEGPGSGRAYLQPQPSLAEGWSWASMLLGPSPPCVLAKRKPSLRVLDVEDAASLGQGCKGTSSNLDSHSLEPHSEAESRPPW